MSKSYCVKITKTSLILQHILWFEKKIGESTPYHAPYSIKYAHGFAVIRVVGRNIMTLGISMWSIYSYSLGSLPGHRHNHKLNDPEHPEDPDMGKTNCHITTIKQNPTAKPQQKANGVHNFRDIIFILYLYILHQLYHSCDSDHVKFKMNLFQPFLVFTSIAIIEMWNQITKQFADRKIQRYLSYKKNDEIYILEFVHLFPLAHIIHKITLSLPLPLSLFLSLSVSIP